MSWSRDAGLRAAAAGRIGGARRRAAGGEPPVDRGAAGGRGDGRQHVPPSEGGVARERRGRARRRRRRSREDEPMGASRPALGQPRAGAGAAQAGRAEQVGEAAARHRHRAGRGRSQRAGGRAGGGRKRSGIERCIGCKPRREPDRFGWERSGIERGIGAEPRSMSDGFAANPAGNPATNPAAQRARGKGTPEPSNLPPQPPDGGSSGGQVSIVEDYITDRGRKRQRTVVVELDAIREQLRAASDGDLADWERIRSELRGLVGESTFEIWLAQLELAATDPGGRLVLAAPASTRSWVARPVRPRVRPRRRGGRSKRAPRGRARAAATRRRSPPPPAPPPLPRRTSCRACHIPSLTRRPYDHHHTVPPRRT